MEKRALLFFDQLNKFENTISIIESSRGYTYPELLKKVGSCQVDLVNYGIQAGDVVLLIGDYSFESVSMFLALYRAGVIIVPVNNINDNEISERLDVCGTCIVINLRNNSVEKHHKASCHPLIDRIRVKGESGLILFSSGSTGKPKAMIHSLDNLVDSYLGKRSKSLVFLVFLMFDHIGGLNTLLNCLSMGSTIVIPQSRRPNEIAELIQKFRVNVLPASPTFLNLMLIAEVNAKFDLRSLKMITYGTEPMPDSLIKKLKLVFPWIKFLQTFGTSETGIVKTSNVTKDSSILKFDDPNQEYKIVNNELWLRSTTQVLGYLNHSNDSFTDDGWFKTGDLAEYTTDGNLKILGRLKEVINVGGEKVLPIEVESVIMEIESVQDCLVRAEKNAITGQMVCADIVLKKGFVFSDEKNKIKNYCKQRLDIYKVPIRIVEIQGISFTDRFKKNRH